MDNNNSPPVSFKFYLKAYSITFLNRSDLEKGDKVLLPPNILQKLSESEIKNPMIFEIKNLNSRKKSYCGVMDFTADDGCAYLPLWMMKNLDFKDGEKIIFNYTFLEKGNYVKLQPQTDDFLKVSNPKAVLEAKLRHFTCLTKSDVIGIEHNSKIYWINVLEVKPGTAISIIDTDIDVDFALPLINEKSELDAAKNNKNIPEIEKKNPAILSNFEDFSSEELNEDIKKSFLGKGEVVR